LKTLSNPQCKQEILVRVGRVRADSPGQWGRMNSAQMLCHLSDSFLCAMGERPVPIDPHFRARKLAKWVALNAPFRWPHGIKTPPQIDQHGGGGTLPAEFEVDRELLLLLVDRFTAQLPDFQFAPHPMFLEMNEREWMRWGYLHSDHHLRQFGV
jgi:hypothetical protein